MTATALARVLEVLERALEAGQITHELAYEAFTAAGDLDRARAMCRERVAWFADDEASCMRAGDFGEATSAEREKDRWAARLRELE